MKLVDENTMTFNNSRRIAGKSKEKVITGAEQLKTQTLTASLTLLLKAADLL
jgi:hypothetical protein